MDSSRHDQLRDWLCAYIAEELQLSAGSIDPAEPMSAYGLDSIRAITMLADVEDHVGFPIDPNALWEFPTVDSFVHMLVEQSAQTTGGTVPWL
jgi:acyl carrier protein